MTQWRLCDSGVARAGGRAGRPAPPPATALAPALALALALSLALALAPGCTTLRTLPRDELASGLELDKSRVHVRGGAAYDFIRVSLPADTLLGEYEVTVEREGRDGLSTFVEERRYFRVPLSQVDSVRVYRRDLGKTLLYAGAAAAGAYVVYELLDADDLGQSSRQPPKEDPPSLR